MADEQLILVDEGNRALGTAGKEAVHRAGLLHRAFSIFAVDNKDRILLQQRNPRKYHSGGLWANSCCGHPRPGERTLSAARRRLQEELGIDCALAFGFYARYHANLDHGMQENEFVYVYFGALHGEPKPNPAEVANLELATVTAITRSIRRRPDRFTSWLRHYFDNHLAEIVRLSDATAHAARPG